MIMQRLYFISIFTCGAERNVAASQLPVLHANVSSNCHLCEVSHILPVSAWVFFRVLCFSNTAQKHASQWIRGLLVVKTLDYRLLGHEFKSQQFNTVFSWCVLICVILILRPRWTSEGSPVSIHIREV